MDQELMSEDQVEKARQIAAENIRLRQAYRSLFAVGGDSAELVLADLRRFCRGDISALAYSSISGSIDIQATMANEGRREVWLRICDATNCDPHTGAPL